MHAHYHAMPKTDAGLHEPRLQLDAVGIDGETPAVTAALFDAEQPGHSRRRDANGTEALVDEVAEEEH